jgi:hypothetical protein
MSAAVGSSSETRPCGCTDLGVRGDVKVGTVTTAQLLRACCPVRVGARGASMFPFLATGDAVTVAPARSYAPGEVVVYSRGEAEVCHRVTRILEREGQRWFLLRGDALLLADKPVSAERILGRVVAVERGRVSVPRRVLLFLQPLLRRGRLNAVVVSALVPANGGLRCAAESCSRITSCVSTLTRWMVRRLRQPLEQRGATP